MAAVKSTKLTQHCYRTTDAHIQIKSKPDKAPAGMELHDPFAGSVDPNAKKKEGSFLPRKTLIFKLLLVAMMLFLIKMSLAAMQSL